MIFCSNIRIFIPSSFLSASSWKGGIRFIGDAGPSASVAQCGCCSLAVSYSDDEVLPTKSESGNSKTDEALAPLYHLFYLCLWLQRLHHVDSFLIRKRFSTNYVYSEFSTFHLARRKTMISNPCQHQFPVKTVPSHPSSATCQKIYKEHNFSFISLRSANEK